MIGLERVKPQNLSFQVSDCASWSGPTCFRRATVIYLCKRCGFEILRRRVAGRRGGKGLLGGERRERHLIKRGARQSAAVPAAGTRTGGLRRRRGHTLLDVVERPRPPLWSADLVRRADL